jgi:N-acetylglucosaminyldiphosphoundecaprenol N-acetyl-beta-D-mannosaminyltransferase
MTERINVLGVQFDNVTMEEAVDRAFALQERHEAPYVVTPNPEIVMLCRADPDAAVAVNAAAMTIPDGIGVIYGARILKTPLKEKVGGCDFSLRLMEKMDAAGRSVFLLGGKPGVAEQAAERLHERFPHLRFVGTNDGYFRDDGPVVEKINAAAPDLLMVCLGAPKQEKWMYAHAQELDAGLMIGAGGSVDVFAGTVERAPEAWCNAGFEWLYRLLKEPRRIGRMMSIPKFLLKVIGERLRGGAPD